MALAEIPFEFIISLIKTVVEMGQNVKANKERCQRVAKRVSSMQELVLKLRERDPSQISEVVRNALQELSATLVNARDMMRKYNQTNAVKSFIKNSAHEDKFNKINIRLDDTFQILSGALQVEQGDILNQVLNAVSGKTAQQAAPCPIGFRSMSDPCPPMPMPMPMPAPTDIPPSSVPSPPPSTPTVSTSPAASPTAPNPPQISPIPAVPAPKMAPAITVTGAQNPPYPPAPRPAFNPNTLSVPSMPMPAPCAMPPRVVTVADPPVYVPPVMTAQGTVYGTLSRVVPALLNPVRTVRPVVYAQAMPPKQIIVTVPAPPVQTSPTVVTYIVNNRPF